MTEQNPDQPKDERPQYGIRLTPEQQAEYQERLNEARQANQPGRQDYPGPPYGQSPYSQSPYGQPGQPAQSQYPYGHQTQGYQQPDYQTPGYQQPLGPIEKPKSIDRSYWLILTAGLAYLVIMLMSLFSPNMGLPPEIMDTYQQQLDAAGIQMDMQSFMEMVRIVSIVLTVVLAGLYWLIATGIRRGSNVARIFGTIFAAISLTGIFGPGFVYVILGVAGIVFAYLPPSSEYLRAKAWEKAMRR